MNSDNRVIIAWIIWRKMRIWNQTCQKPKNQSSINGEKKWNSQRKLFHHNAWALWEMFHFDPKYNLPIFTQFQYSSNLLPVTVKTHARAWGSLDWNMAKFNRRAKSKIGKYPSNPKSRYWNDFNQPRWQVSFSHSKWSNIAPIWFFFVLFTKSRP